MVFDEELRLSGSIDMVFEAPDGSLQIFDWKRSKEIKKHNPWENSHRECISHLPDSNFWHYALQLNTYKAILERNYGKKVTDLYLVCLHPNNKNKDYMKIRVPILKDEIADLFDLRRKLLKEDGEKHEENN
jgi:CRISPR/Cas system-associated exonuclease Cas4 (RecB family)